AHQAQVGHLVQVGHRLRPVAIAVCELPRQRQVALDQLVPCPRVAPAMAALELMVRRSQLPHLLSKGSVPTDGAVATLTGHADDHSPGYSSSSGSSPAASLSEPSS